MTSWEEHVARGSFGSTDLAALAQQYGTPAYIYSGELIDAATTQMQASTRNLDVRLRYALKANANLAVLTKLKQAGFGFDIASALELSRVQHIGASPADLIYTGPGKSHAELAAFIELGGEEIICDSAAELDRIIAIAEQLQQQVCVGVRVNPDIQAGGHPHISTGMKDSKFGVDRATAIELLKKIAAHKLLTVGCLNCHIGSQIDVVAPYQQAVTALVAIKEELASAGIDVALLDLGGGFGIGDTTARPTQDVFAQLCSWLATKYPEQQVGFQPGRSLVGRAGILLTTVEYVKDKHIIVDAGMTELLRPALYNASHGVAKVGQPLAGRGDKQVVGPVCESSDWLVKDCDLNVQADDLLAIFDAGAYAAVMMSGYNGRLRPAEIMLDNDQVTLVRRRDTIADVLAAEQL